MGDFQASKPAIKSKINAVALAMPSIIVLLCQAFPAHAGVIGQAGSVIQGVLTYVLRTWFTNTSISGAI